MSTVTLYSFEGANGGEDGTYTTFNAQEAKEHGQKYQLRVIANEYEFSESETAWDFREKFVQFEYDQNYYGGDYSGTGQFAYVPAHLVEEGAEEEAFEAHTGINKIHVIHYSSDEEYTSEGELIES